MSEWKMVFVLGKSHASTARSAAIDWSEYFAYSYGMYIPLHDQPDENTLAYTKMGLYNDIICDARQLLRESDLNGLKEENSQLVLETNAQIERTDRLRTALADETVETDRLRTALADETVETDRLRSATEWYRKLGEIHKEHTLLSEKYASYEGRLGRQADISGFLNAYAAAFGNKAVNTMIRSNRHVFGEDIELYDEAVEDTSLTYQYARYTETHGHLFGKAEEFNQLQYLPLLGGINLYYVNANMTIDPGHVLTMDIPQGSRGLSFAINTTGGRGINTHATISLTTNTKDTSKGDVDTIRIDNIAGTETMSVPELKYEIEKNLAAYMNKAKWLVELVPNTWIELSHITITEVTETREGYAWLHINFWFTDEFADFADKKCTYDHPYWPCTEEWRSRHIPIPNGHTVQITDGSITYMGTDYTVDTVDTVDTVE
jgi:hypothetical protein